MQTNEYFESEEFKYILSEFEDAERMGVPCIISSDEYTDIAEYYHSKGDSKKAKHTVETAIRLYPGSTMPLVYAARLALVVDNDPMKADEYVEQIDDKSDWECIYISAEILIFQGHDFEAEAFLRDHYENLSQGEQDDFAIDVAGLYADYEKWAFANMWIEDCIDKTSVPYREMKSRILIGLGDHENGETLINKLLDEDPFSNKYWNELAASQLTKGDIHNSISSSEYSLAIAPNDVEAIMNKANGLVMLSNYDEALKYYARLRELVPDDCNSEFMTAMCYINKEQDDKGLEHLQKAEKLLTPDNKLAYDVYYEMAFCLSKKKQMHKALEYVDKADACECNHDEMTVLRGHIFLENGCEEEAMGCYLKAITDSDTDTHIVIRVAVSAIDNGYIKGAYDILHKILDSNDENNNEGYSYLARCCYQLKKHDEFMEYLKKGVEVNPNEAQLVFSELFPAGMRPEEYYEYAKNNFK